MKKFRFWNAGFTLLEVIVTISIAAILVVSVSGIFIQAYKIRRYALEKQNMSLAAQSAIEKYIYSVEECNNQVGECNGYTYQIIKLNEIQLRPIERELIPYGFSKIKVIIKNKKHSNSEIIWGVYVMDKTLIK